MPSEPSTPSEAPLWPACGLRDCLESSALVDEDGVGYCEPHRNQGLHAGTSLRPALYIEDFDPWVVASQSRPEAFRDLDYGCWPPGMTRPADLRPGWGLPT